MKKITSTLFVVVILLLSGCGGATLNKAEKDGKTALEAQEIFDLVSGNTMHLISYDFEAKVFFDENGGLGAIDNDNQRDTGSWDIKDNNQLCIKFRVWYYADIKCYSIVPGENQRRFSFYSPNGAAYYSGSLQQGDPAKLGNDIRGKQSSQFLRGKLAAQKNDTKTARPATTDVSTRQSTPVHPGVDGNIKRLAQNCPGCNLAGADLKEANLVNADLQGADLSGADLRYANLRRAKLAGANLSNARLNQANLPGADLRGCNLRNANLKGANLILADLTDADLTGADLTNTHFENTKGIEKQ